MLIAIIGESCTGKTTIVNELKKTMTLTVYSGKDYLKLDKNPQNAKEKFKSLLKEVKEEHIVYVITEKEHLELLPATAKKILVTAEIEVIKERFKVRMRGHLPKPVEMMLERKHGMFDTIDHDIHISHKNLKQNVKTILDLLNN